MTPRVLLLASLLFTIACGCTSSTTPTGVVFRGEPHATVELPSGSTLGMSNNFTVATEGANLSLKDDILHIDGKSYGKVAKGDKVKLEKSGKVLVNGDERKPEQDK